MSKSCDINLNELNELIKYNKNLTKRLIRLIYLKDNKIKLKTGSRGGKYYLSKNNNKIYLKNN